MKDITLHLRQESKRMDLPLDVIRTLCEAYAALIRLEEERDAALAVVDEFIIDTTTNNETPIHECGFRYDPEKGKCDACEAWGNYVGLFCSSEEEETL